MVRALYVPMEGVVAGMMDEENEERGSQFGPVVRSTVRTKSARPARVELASSLNVRCDRVDAGGTHPILKG